MVRAKLRRMGNSLGVIIPSDEIQRRGLREGEEVEVDVKKALTLMDVYGALEGKIGDVDELNDIVDEGEDLG